MRPPRLRLGPIRCRCRPFLRLVVQQLRLSSGGAAVSERLLALSPDWAEGHRHLSGSLAAAGDLDGAVAHALRAAELMPEDNGTAIHAAELLLRCGHVDQPAALVRAAAARQPSDDRVLRVLSAIEMLLERLRAPPAALRAAWANTPQHPQKPLPPRPPP